MLNPSMISGLCTFVASLCEESSPGIVFVHRVDDAKRLSEALSSTLGVEVPYVCGELSKAIREEIAHALRASKDGIRVVVSTGVWSTGINIPNLAWVVRTTNGTACIPLEQEAGRGARVTSEKHDFAIYDVVDASCETGTEKADKRASEWIKRGYAAGDARIDSPRFKDLDLTRKYFDSLEEGKSEFDGVLNDPSVGVDDAQKAVYWQEILDAEDDRLWSTDPYHCFANKCIKWLCISSIFVSALAALLNNC